MNPKSLIYKAILRILKPLAKVLIEHGISYQEFDRLTKQTFVEVADKDFKLPNKKQSISRVSLLTGINRKEVQAIKDDPEKESSSHHKHNRAASVVSGWVRDALYAKKILPVTGEVSFSSLVKQYSGDIPVKAILNELLNVGAVAYDESGHVYLVKEAYIPSRSAVDKFDLVADSVRDLLNTGAFNMAHQSGKDRMQLSVSYDLLPEEAVKEFKKMSDKKAMQLFREFDCWLAEHEVDDIEAYSEPLYRAGLGMFYIEELRSDEDDSE